jgi:predicted phage tail protein
MDQSSPSRSRKSLDDRLATLAERQQQLTAQQQSLLAVKKTADAKRATRRRIIVGAAIIAAAEEPEVRRTVARLLDAQVTKKTERAAIADLLEPALKASGGS